MSAALTVAMLARKFMHESAGVDYWGGE